MLLASLGTGGCDLEPVGPILPVFAVGGVVSGVPGPGLVLQINGGEGIAIGADGAFAFQTKVSGNYNVTVSSQPGNGTCSVAGGTGTARADVSVVVTCSLGFSIASASDPLALQQWHLKNTGQSAFADLPGASGMDINVDPVFSAFGYAGSGVTVAVVDTGMEIAHEDLAANVVPNGSWNFNTGGFDPTNTAAASGDHGTSVAGLIAMVRNAVGGIGVAPSARLKGFNLLSMAVPTEVAFLDSIGASSAGPNSQDVFIFNQSFGISTARDIAVDPDAEAQYRFGVTSLRGGRGALYLKAGGNGFLGYADSGTGVDADCAAANDTQSFAGGTFSGLSCENASFDPDNTLPFQIVVGATNAGGVKATYSTAGSAIWVSAPGGEFGRNQALEPGFIAAVYSPAMVTTDQSGCARGFSSTSVNHGSAFDNSAAPNGRCNYTNGMNGTSSATPLTAGVIALMLEANPALTWRDVKHILASTARQVDAARAAVTVLLPNPAPDSPYIAEPAWTVNKAAPTPFHFHNWYGFGMVDASAAVNMARTYTLGQLGSLSDTGFIASAEGLALAIPDDSAAGLANVLSVPNTPAVQVVEAVQIGVAVTHPSAGDLGVELVSPQGTRSVLKTIRDGFTGSADLGDMILLSNAFYGENPTGAWTIKIVDGNPANTGTLNSWAIRVYGH